MSCFAAGTARLPFAAAFFEPKADGPRRHAGSQRPPVQATNRRDRQRPAEQHLGRPVAGTPRASPGGPVRCRPRRSSADCARASIRVRSRRRAAHPRGDACRSAVRCGKLLKAPFARQSSHPSWGRASGNCHNCRRRERDRLPRNSRGGLAAGTRLSRNSRSAPRSFADRCGVAGPAPHPCRAGETIHYIGHAVGHPGIAGSRLARRGRSPDNRPRGSSARRDGRRSGR